MNPEEIDVFVRLILENINSPKPTDPIQRMPSALGGTGTASRKTHSFLEPRAKLLVYFTIGKQKLLVNTSCGALELIKDMAALIDEPIITSIQRGRGSEKIIQQKSSFEHSFSLVEALTCEANLVREIVAKAYKELKSDVIS